MADGRMLKKKISLSRRLAALKSDSARLLYTWLLPHLDIEGRFSADPDVIKGQVVPRLNHLTAIKIDELLQDIASQQLIIRYENDGDRFLQLRRFRDEQNLRKDREKDSDIPSPNKDNIINGLKPVPGKLPDKAGNKPAQVKLSYIKLREDKVATQEFRLSEYLVKLIKERNENFKQPPLEKWAENIDLMIRVDKRDPEEIKEVIEWCQQDEFWQDNILSTSKLRKQYDQLIMKMNKGSNQDRPKGTHVEYRGRNWVDVRKEQMEGDGLPLKNKTQKQEDIKGDGKRTKHLKKWRKDQASKYAKTKK